MKHPDVTLPDRSWERSGPAATRPTLVIAWHPEPRFIGRALALQPGVELILGRGGEDFGARVLDDSRLSRQHLGLTWTDDAVHAEDKGSLNGCTRNGAALHHGPVFPGDVLGLGKLYLVLRNATETPRRRPHPTIIGSSAALTATLVEAERVAPHPTTVLLLGETGTGKELLARHIHEQSGRSGDFVPVNCGGLSDELLHSELFGHTRGAFSGAANPRRGLAMAAEGGTLFLDEIGEAPPSVQVALLRLLQDREVRPVGADRPVRVDLRFIAATHRDLAAEVALGRFREDLLARLSRWVITLPALRARREDIIPVALHAAEQAAGRPMSIPRALALQLLTRDWPGNLRELVGVIERLVIEAGDEDSLPRADWLDASPMQAQGGIHNQPTPAPAPPRIDRSPKPQPSPEALAAMLAEEGGNKKALAARLGVGRSTLYRWLGGED